MNLTHPDSKQTLDVDPDHAETYLSQGWVEKVEKVEKQSEKPPTPATKKD